MWGGYWRKNETLFFVKDKKKTAGTECEAVCVCSTHLAPRGVENKHQAY